MCITGSVSAGLALLTRALLRLERTMNLLCHLREGGGEGRDGWKEGARGREG